jgi:hypothetical protein
VSNYLAIATVTSVLQSRMSALVLAPGSVSGYATTTTRPDLAAANKGPWINIFLYQAAPNVAYRNDDLPTRRADGKQLTQRPKAALVLRYLISVAGDDTKLDSHHLLGAVVRELHAQPVVSPSEIQGVKTGPLAASNLDEQLDNVRFMPLNLSTEELSKIWSTFFEIPYLLSVAYEVSPILIETDDTPAQALPVQPYKVNIYALPFRQPQIEAVVSQAGDNAPIFAKSVLLIKGKQLKGDTTTVLMNDGEHIPAVADISDTQIRLPVPAGAQAGIQGLQVVQKLLIGTPETPHSGTESNVASFVLRPRTTAVTKITLQDHGIGPVLSGLAVTVDVTVGPDQRAALLLNPTTTGNHNAYRIAAQPLAVAGSKLEFITANVSAGTYFLRVMIDGADSPLDLDPTSATFGPTVTLP